MAEIFILEDSRELRKVLVTQLRDEDHNVTAFEDGTASSSPELVSQADLIVTDITMPEVDGLEAIANIRDTSPDLPIIIITGQPVIVPKSLGVKAVLRKPFTEETFLNSVKEALAKSA